MANNEFINRKNFLFDKYENKSKDNIFNFNENFHYAFPKILYLGKKIILIILILKIIIILKKIQKRII